MGHDDPGRFARLVLKHEYKNWCLNFKVFVGRVDLEIIDFLR